MMRVLHVVKTSNGAEWAALQAAELVRLGVDVHVALPFPEGNTVRSWQQSGAILHFVTLDFPVRAPWRLPGVCRAARQLIAELNPDIVHSHFVGTTLVLRRALGKRHPIPRVFQIPGPLHLEHSLFRVWELSTAGASDYWVASSRYIQSLYSHYGVPRERLFLSYYGFRCDEFSAVRSGVLRQRLGVPADSVVAGNISYMYAPKYYLGQHVGVKCHEHIIAALALAMKKEPRLIGVLVGSAWGQHKWYEHKLRRMALAMSGGRIYMPGFVCHEEIRGFWPDFDVVLHVPLSENCGGVHEPMVAGVPVIAGRVGGLPELVIDGVTGRTVEPRRPDLLADLLLEVLSDLERYRAIAVNGRALVTSMFDVRRTSGEIFEIYKHILDRRHPRPNEFGLQIAADDERKGAILP